MEEKKEYDGRLLLWALKFFHFLLELLPYKARIKVLEMIVRFVVAVVPKYKRYAYKNLDLVFPDKDNAWKDDIIRRHCRVLALIVVDFFRLPNLDEKWYREHVKFPNEDEFVKFAATNPKLGSFFMTGHLSSFELLPTCLSFYGVNVSIVVRNMRQKLADEWWNAFRCTHGNSVIPRKGAVRGMVKHILAGKNIGFLFDQNVKRNNAVFVNWFGRPAATTKAFGQLAMKYHTQVCIMCLRTVGIDQYEICFEPINLDDLYNNPAISDEEGMRIITERCVAVLERMIKEEPADWFWFHRRWRTTPSNDIPEDFYLS